jgi:uroporphyrin-III C-methyltransferase
MSAKVWLVGAGPGDPELLTLKAVKALKQAEIVMIDDLVNPAVLEHCPQARIIPVGKRGGCRSTPQAFIHRLMLRYARQGKCVVRLKGGDPCIFGRGSEEADWLAEHGIEVEMVNGITAGLAGATQCGIPLTLRGVARGVTLVTAHTQDDSSLNWPALAQSGTTLVQPQLASPGAERHHPGGVHGRGQAAGNPRKPAGRRHARRHAGSDDRERLPAPPARVPQHPGRHATGRP